MLLEFSVANFKSIAERQVFSMLPAKGSTHLHRTGNEHFPEALKVAAFFGPNGSGKTKFLEAIDLFRELVIGSGKYSSTDVFKLTPFKLDEALVEAPTTMEVLFVFLGDVWRYGFELTPSRVHREWLYRRPADTGREQRYFERSGQELGLSSRFGKIRAVAATTTAPNQLLLSKLDQLNSDLTKDPYSWISAFLRTVTSGSEFFRSITESETSAGQICPGHH